MNNKGFAGVVGVISLAAVFIIGCIFFSKLYYVSPGNVGVMILKSGQNTKGVNEVPLTPGWGFRKLFVEEVAEYPVYLQTAVWTNAEAEGNRDIDEAITANTSEGLPVNMDVSVSYTLEPAKIPDLYVKYRSKIEDIQSTYLRQSVRQAIQDVFGSYTVDQIYGEKKQEVATKIQANLVTKLKDDGFNFQQFTINEIRLPQNIVDSINQKIAASQSALKAEQDLSRIKIEAEQRVAQAQAEAQAIKLQSDAANNDKYIALKQLEVQVEAVKRWNGVLPTQMIPGSSVPFINLK